MILANSILLFLGRSVQALKGNMQHPYINRPFPKYFKTNFIQKSYKMRFYFILAITGLTSAIYLPQMDRLNLQSVSKMGKYKFGKGRRLQKHISVSP